MVFGGLIFKIFLSHHKQLGFLLNSFACATFVKSRRLGGRFEHSGRQVEVWTMGFKHCSLDSLPDEVIHY